LVKKVFSLFNLLWLNKKIRKNRIWKSENTLYKKIFLKNFAKQING
jgi:hypothetical protein